MSITSHEFLLIFLPLVLVGYYGLFHTSRRKMFFLLFISYGFYALADLKFLPILLALSFLTYWFAKREWFSWGIALNIGGLLLFKYWNFGMDTFALLMSNAGFGTAGTLLRLGLPLGISFYSFKHIGYLLDVQRQRYVPTDDFWSFATFSVYFPQISAGPISSYQDTAGQFSNLPVKLSQEQIYTGLFYLSVGLVKKVLIADILGRFLASPYNSIDGFSGLFPAWYLVIAYAMQLYFDFSGYTDMVLGVSTLFGVALPKNFNNPYLAGNPAEFWERWHISLSKWFNYYLFSPASRSLLRKWGSAKRDQAQYVANLGTMTLVGLWHGTGWSFILWGIYHGVLLNVNAFWKRKNRPLPFYVGRPLFILSILLGWALFMSPNSDYLVYLLAQLIGLGGLGEWDLMLELIKGGAAPALFVAVALSASGLSEAENLINTNQSHTVGYAIAWGALAALCLFLLGEQIQFLYVQF